MKIIVAIPSQDDWKADFALCLIRMLSYSTERGLNCTISNERGCYIDMIRNKLVLKAQDENADFILFLDADMTFPAHTLVQLIQSADSKDVIGCNYVRRRPPFSPTAMGMDGQTIMPGRIGLEKVIAVPTGVILINMKVFNDVKYPWFECRWGTKYTDSPEIIMYGEDTRFCAMAHKAGHPVYCDHDLSTEIGHLGQFEYKMEHFKNET